MTKEGSPDFVPGPERIATFDNDGTLWAEQPVYFQVAFAFDRIAAVAKQRPELRNKQPYKAAIERNMNELAKSGEKGLLQIIAATHTPLGIGARELRMGAAA